MNKIKILIIHSTLEDSGLTNVILNICKNFNQELFEIHVITLSKEPRNSKLEIFKKLPIKISSLNLSRVRFILNGKTSLLCKIDEIQPDIIHTHGLRANLFVSKSLRGYPWITTIHGDLEKNYSNTYGSFIGKYFAKKELNALKNASFKVAVSSSLKNLLSGVLKNVLVVQNGVDEEVFKKISKLEKEAIKSKLLLNDKEFIIVSVGSLSNRKDPITIINAFKKSKLTSNFRLVFLGDGPLKQECIEVSKGFDIEFLGNVKNTDEYLKASDFFISASQSEGLPNSVLEAGMSGLTCILSDIPQHREIFQVVTSQAVFFKTKSISELANILDNLPMRENDETINFSAKKMTLEYENLYLEAFNSIP